MNSYFIDNSSNVLSNLGSLYSNKNLTDLCLIVRGKEFLCHRLILSACSDVFRVMLMNFPWNESHESRVELHEAPECVTIFDSFINYLYTGKISICLESALPILLLADKYNVQQLRNEVLHYMTSHIACAAHQGLLLPWIEITHKLNYKGLEKKISNFLRWNLDLCEKNLIPDSSCSFETAEVLQSLLKQSDLVVYNEITLLKYTVGWLEQLCGQCKEMADMDALFFSLMSYIRFGMITPSQMAQIQLHPIAAHFKSYFDEKMKDCIAFFRGEIYRIRDIVSREEGYLQNTPRLYTSHCHSSTLTIERYSCVPTYQTSTLVFSSHPGVGNNDEDRPYEWVVDVQPKGVQMKKCYLIEWEGKVEVPEVVIPTVRISITCKDPPPLPAHLRVKVGILIYGSQNNIECIRTVLERIYCFSEVDMVLRLDNIIPFEDLNPAPRKRLISEYLVGQHRDTFMMHVIIRPIGLIPS